MIASQKLAELGISKGYGYSKIQAILKWGHPPVFEWKLTNLGIQHYILMRTFVILHTPIVVKGFSGISYYKMIFYIQKNTF